MVRLEIEGANINYLALTFTSRKNRNGEISERMPFLEDHIKQIREFIGMEIINSDAKSING
jgi:hypothetical protein